jgi:hypothetical protein
MLQTYVSLLQMFQWYVANVSCRCCKSRSGYCICCNGYTVCCTVFQTYVVSVFNWMLRMFHTYVCKCFCQCICFAMEFQVFLVFSLLFLMHVSSVSSYFRHMLQKFHLNVSKVDRMLYMLQCNSPATAVCCSCRDAVHACGKWRDGALRGCEREKRCRRSPGTGVQQPQTSV